MDQIAIDAFEAIQRPENNPTQLENEQNHGANIQVVAYLLLIKKIIDQPTHDLLKSKVQSQKLILNNMEG